MAVLGTFGYDGGSGGGGIRQVPCVAQLLASDEAIVIVLGRVAETNHFLYHRRFFTIKGDHATLGVLNQVSVKRA